jgi:hypothetical protein
MTPPNLRDLFGDRYRIGHDPAAETYAEKDDPSMQTLLCQNGIIYTHGANRLAVECKTATAKRLAALPGVTRHQQGDTEWTLLFNLAAFDAVAAIVKPRKRRKWSDDKRQAMRKHLFKPKSPFPRPKKGPRTHPER